MAGITSALVKDVLGLRQPETIDRPVAASNPPFIEDDLGTGHPRAVREASRFTAFASQLVKDSAPADPPQATVKVPRLVLTRNGWDVVLHTISGAVTLTVNRASRFQGKADLSEPSKTLADFVQGRGRAWTDFRDDDLPPLLIAWARAVEPSPDAARWTSSAIALAMAARAGIAVASFDHVFAGEQAA